jgi:hypothetical protein
MGHHDELLALFIFRDPGVFYVDGGLTFYLSNSLRNVPPSWKYAEAFLIYIQYEKVQFLSFNGVDHLLWSFALISMVITT